MAKASSLGDDSRRVSGKVLGQGEPLPLSCWQSFRLFLDLMSFHFWLWIQARVQTHYTLGLVMGGLLL